MVVESIIYKGEIERYHGKKVTIVRAFYWDTFARECRDWKGTLCDLGSGGKTLLPTQFPNEKILMVESSSYVKYRGNNNNVVNIISDIEDMSEKIEDNSIDGVLCGCVLEHVKDPEKVLSEIYRILKPGGNYCIAVPWLYPYHCDPRYFLDYWRFSQDGIRHLLEKHGFKIDQIFGENKKIEKSLVLVCIGKKEKR